MIHTMHIYLRFCLTALLMTLCLSVGTVAMAQDLSEGQVARIRKEVSNEIMSPFCPGKNLDMCTSPNAAAVRRDIQDMARAGKDKAQIKKAILAQYGEEFKVIEPPAEDDALLLAMIFGGLIAAISLLVFITRRKKRSTTTTDSHAPVSDASLEQKEAPLDEDELAYINRLNVEREG